MAKREWIGEYWLIGQEFKTYKNEWVEVSINLGKCLCVEEACEKAVIAICRDFSTSQLRDVYILDGWGHLTYM